MEFAPNQLVFLSILLNLTIGVWVPGFLDQQSSKNASLLHLLTVERLQERKTPLLSWILWLFKVVEHFEYHQLEQNQGGELGWPLKKTQSLYLPYLNVFALSFSLFCFSFINSLLFFFSQFSIVVRAQYEYMCCVSQMRCDLLYFLRCISVESY